MIRPGACYFLSFVPRSLPKAKITPQNVRNDFWSRILIGGKGATGAINAECRAPASYELFKAVAHSQRHILVNRFTDRRLQEMRGVTAAFPNSSNGDRPYVLGEDYRAVAAFPLISREESGASLEGLILAKSRKENAFDPEIVDVLKAPITVIASGIKMGKFMCKAHLHAEGLENAVQQSLDRQRALVERHKSMGQLVDAVLATLIDSQGFEPSRVATIVCSISKAMLAGADVTLFIRDTVEESEEFIEDDMHQIDNDLRKEIVVSAIAESGASSLVTAPCGALKVIEQCRQVFIKRVSDLSVYTPWRVLSAKPGGPATGEHSVICVPIHLGVGEGERSGGGSSKRKRQRCFGAIEAHRFVNPGSAFEKSDFNLLEQIARICAFCISAGQELGQRQSSIDAKNASLKDSVEKVVTMSAQATTAAARIRTLELILRTTQEASGAEKPELIFDIARERGRLVSGAQACRLFIINEAEGILWTLVKEEDEYVKYDLRIEDSMSITCTVAKKCHSIRITNTNADTRFEPSVDAIGVDHVSSMICCPVKGSGSDLRGALVVVKTVSEPFTVRLVSSSFAPRREWQRNSQFCSLSLPSIQVQDQSALEELAGELGICLDVFQSYENTKMKATKATNLYDKCHSDLVRTQRIVVERETKLEDLSSVLRAHGSIERATDTQELFEIVATELPHFLKCYEATLFVLEHGAEGGHLWTADSDEPVVALGTGPIGRTVQDGEIREVAATLPPSKSLSMEKKTDGNDETLLSASLLHVPLVPNPGDEPLGVLRLRCKPEQFASSGKRCLVEDMAASLARVLLSCLVHQKAVADLNDVIHMITVQAVRLNGDEDSSGNSGASLEAGFSSLFLEVGTELSRLLSCKMCTICLIGSDQRPIISRAQMRAHGELVSHVAITHVVEAREDLLVSDDAGMSAFDHGGHINNMLCVPIVSSGSGSRQDYVSAVLQATNKNMGAFTESDLSMLKTVGEHLRCVVDATKRYARSQFLSMEREKCLIELFDTFGGIDSGGSEAQMELAQALGDAASKALSAERVNLYLWDPELGKYAFFATAGPGNPREEDWFPASKGIVGCVISRGQSLRLGSVRAHQSFDVSIDEPNGTRVNTAMYCPILDRQRAPLGAIQVANKLKGGEEENIGFSEEDERLLLIIARAVASHLLAIESLDDAVLEGKRLLSQATASSKEVKKLEADKNFHAQRSAIAEGLVLNGTGDALALESDLFENLHTTVQKVLGGAKCALYVANYKSMNFELRRKGVDPEQVSMSDGLFQNIIKEREVIFFEDARAILGSDFYAKDFILAPLCDPSHGDIRGKSRAPALLGAIAFFNGESRAVSKADVQSCLLLCTHFARLFTTVHGIGRLETELRAIAEEKEKSNISARKLQVDLLFASRLLQIHGELDVLGKFSVS